MWIWIQILIVFDNFVHRFSKSCQILFLSFVTYVPYCPHHLKASAILLNWIYFFGVRRGSHALFIYKPRKLKNVDLSYFSPIIFECAGVGDPRKTCSCSTELQTAAAFVPLTIANSIFLESNTKPYTTLYEQSILCWRDIFMVCACVAYVCVHTQACERWSSNFFNSVFFLGGGICSSHTNDN